MAIETPLRRFWWAPVPLALGAALAVRLPGIASRPIWYDEAFAILFARRGPAAMAYGTLAPDALGSAADIHPLGYYTVLWAWMGAFGESVTAARLLSILIGLGLVWIGTAFSMQLFGRAVAYWAGAFLALSPFLVHYAQEIRMYGLLAALLLAAIVFFWRATGRMPGQAPGRADWIGFAVCAALAMYTHNLAAFTLLPLAAIPVLRRDWNTAGKTALAGAGALLLYLPWLVRLPGQLAKVDASYWTSPPDSGRLVTALLTFTTNLPVPPAWLPLALLAAVLTLVLGLWQTARALRRGEPGASNGAWLAYLTFIPALLMFAVSQRIPVFIERALLPSGAVFAIWAAWALRGTLMPSPVRITAAAVLAAGMGLGIAQHLTYGGFPYAPYRELNTALAEGQTSAGVIVHANKLSAFPAYLDRPDLSHRYLQDIPGSGSDTLALPTQEVIGYFADPDVQTAAAGADRVWYVVFNRQLAEMSLLFPEGDPGLAWLERNYRLESLDAWGDLQVFEFTQP